MTEFLHAYCQQLLNLILCNTYKLSEMYCNNFSVPNKKGKKKLEMEEENVP